ncbi:MAG: dTDP-4-dehydrorhamnose 3,5-epimerase [Candidatus Omnitrophota bacterium]
MPFVFEKLEIPDVILVKPRVFNDDRGFFLETYKFSDFAEYGIKDVFTQDNYSRSSRRGTVRGLHYQQEPMAQAKLIFVVKGSIFDVAVDIREASPTYGKYAAVVLSDDNNEMLYVPKGFAHGFCTLEDNTQVIYKCSEIYSAGHERGIIWNDPGINIKWPVSVPYLSDKDRAYPRLAGLK